MFCFKKKLKPQKTTIEDDSAIDFAWLQYIAMSKLGFSWNEYGLMTYGLWVDLFETFKKESNFETNRGIYALNEEPPIDSIDSI